MKCYIVIELKTTEFKPEYSGKLNFYINIVDDKIKNNDDNPTILLLICKDKNKKVVEYALKGIKNPLAVSMYSFKELPENIKNNLPTDKDIEKFIKQL